MGDDFLLSEELKKTEEPTNNFDDLFNNLSSDITSFNKYVEGINRQRKENNNDVKEINEEKQRIDKAKIDFENYVRAKNSEIDRKISDLEDYLKIRKDNLQTAEIEFKDNMDKSISELDVLKKEIELERYKLDEEKKQFEEYKEIELSRMKHTAEILNAEKEQFEKYKDITNKKLEIENRNLEKKCEKLRGLIDQFNIGFKSMIKEEKEG